MIFAVAESFTWLNISSYRSMAMCSNMHLGQYFFFGACSIQFEELFSNREIVVVRM